jgi:ABC-type polysaccharide/polyol phosphate transport system ATPase subunit
MARIVLQDVSLTFQVRQHQRASLKEYLVGRARRRPTVSGTTIEALRRINLDVREGDRLGILGNNGAGKSTLLKVVAGVYPPTSGSCRTVGRIGSLFDLTLGFEAEATGWENIALRCYLEGDNPHSMRSRAAPIAEFSGLGEFLDMPLRHYSAGMIVRLAFSIATASDPEILLMDEVISAGDARFQEQVRRRIEQMMGQARIIVFSSHDLAALQRLCSRAIWLEQGRIRMHGPCPEVIAAYVDSVQAAARRAA